MNRRGFFGALATLPFWRRVKLNAPAAASSRVSRTGVGRYTVELAGMNAWIPAHPPDDTTMFFGVMRDIDWREVGE